MTIASGRYLILFMLVFEMSFISVDEYIPAPEISMKGVYYTIHDNPEYSRVRKSIECLFFYEDGTCGFLSNGLTEVNESASPDYLLDNLIKYQYTVRWGYYSVSKDTIYARFYIHDSQRMGNIAEEWQMVIRDKDSIDVLKTTCDRCKGQYTEYGTDNIISFQPVKGFEFIAGVLKPDSSQARIRRKKWFQEKLNHSDSHK